MKGKILETFRVAALIAVLLSVSALSGCVRETEGRGDFFGTFTEIKIKGNKSGKTADAVLDRFRELDALFSAEGAASDVAAINAAGENEPVRVSPETYGILELCARYAAETEGVFNVCSYPLSELWKFTPETYTPFVSDWTPPDGEAVERTLARCRPEDLALLPDGTVLKRNGDLKIGFGAVAKGYAGDEAVRLLPPGTSGVINVGGSVFTAGEGEYAVAIGNPRDSSFPYFAKLRVGGGAVMCTSGDYQRYYETRDGKRYGHIFGPDGYPAHADGIVSVTVISENGAASGADADILSTAIFAAGRERGAELAKRHGVGAVIIYEDRTYETVNCREGLFALTDTGYHVRAD